ncbi:hypothetical protein GCM10028791_24860 [Echinicola sediminis]
MAIKEKADLIVACGGDGTINEVATSLVGSNIPLGIIPMGSGNGLASNLNIPLDIPKALEVIKTGGIDKIDVGKVNGTYFFSNMGIGFDTALIHQYDKIKKRQLSGYLRAMLSTVGTFSGLKNVQIEYDGKKIALDPFLVFISNSNRMGYGFTLTPQAKLNDGFFDLVIIDKLPKLKIPLLAGLLLIKKVHWLKQVRFHQVQHLKLSGNKPIEAFQIDGCYESNDSTDLEIDLIRQGLSVLTPS